MDDINLVSYGTAPLVNPTLTHMGMRLNHKAQTTDLIIGVRCYVLEVVLVGISLEFYYNDPQESHGPPLEVIDPLWEPTLNNSQGFQASAVYRDTIRRPFRFPDQFTVPHPQFIRGSKITDLETGHLYLICGTIEGIHHRLTINARATLDES